MDNFPEVLKPLEPYLQPAFDEERCECYSVISDHLLVHRDMGVVCQLDEDVIVIQDGENDCWEVETSELEVSKIDVYRKVEEKYRG